MSDSQVTIKATRLNFNREVEYLMEGDNWLQWGNREEVSRWCPQDLPQLIHRMTADDADDQPSNEPAVYQH